MNIEYKNNYLELSIKPFFTTETLDYSIERLNSMRLKDNADRHSVDYLKATLKVLKDNPKCVLYQSYQLRKMVLDVLSLEKRPTEILKESKQEMIYSSLCDLDHRELYHIAEYGFKKEINKTQQKANLIMNKKKRFISEKINGTLAPDFDPLSYFKLEESEILCVEQIQAYMKLEVEIEKWRKTLTKEQKNNLKNNNDDPCTLILLEQLKRVVLNCNIY